MVIQMPKGTSENYDFKEDNTTTGITYFGKAARKSGGNDTSAAVWQIFKEVDDGAGNTTVTWADGSDDFIKIWNDRAIYSY